MRPNLSTPSGRMTNCSFEYLSSTGMHSFVLVKSEYVKGDSACLATKTSFFSNRTNTPDFLIMWRESRLSPCHILASAFEKEKVLCGLRPMHITWNPFWIASSLLQLLCKTNKYLQISCPSGLATCQLTSASHSLESNSETVRLVTRASGATMAVIVTTICQVLQGFWSFPTLFHLFIKIISR